MFGSLSPVPTAFAGIAWIPPFGISTEDIVPSVFLSLPLDPPVKAVWTTPLTSFFWSLLVLNGPVEIISSPSSTALVNLTSKPLAVLIKDCVDSKAKAFCSSNNNSATI